LPPSGPKLSSQHVLMAQPRAPRARDLVAARQVGSLVTAGSASPRPGSASRGERFWAGDTKKLGRGAAAFFQLRRLQSDNRAQGRPASEAFEAMVMQRNRVGERRGRSVSPLYRVPGSYPWSAGAGGGLPTGERAASIPIRSMRRFVPRLSLHRSSTRRSCTAAALPCGSP